MLVRSILARRSILPPHTWLHTSGARYLSLPTAVPPPPQQKSWLTKKVQQSPAALGIFLAVAKALGYGNPRQVAGRRAWALYEKLCAVRADEDRAFWKDECHLPPTFQSWFTITNLHVWLLTVRLRALPKPHGPEHIQGLIDHFFIDVEDRIRAVLQPGPTPPYTSASGFYINPNTAPESESESQAEPNADGNPRKPRGRAPDRLVSQQMKIFKEQWAGMGMSLDLGLIQGDADMAGAVWRNLLGARGARGIAFEPPSSSSQQHFRRSINLVGGKVENVAKVDARGLDVEEARDDGSGVHDFAWSEVDKYLRYPEVMVDVISYLRRELVRLERLSDEEVMSGELEKLKFGHIRQSPN